jgi:cytochrome c
MARLSSLFVILGAASTLSAAVWARNGEDTASTGYRYTLVQAERGKPLYMEHCAVCHGAGMDGIDEAPSLVGDRFDSHWRKRPAELFSKVKLSMPQDDPGSLSAEQATDIVAAILHANRVPN